MEKLNFNEMSPTFREHRNFLKLSSVLVDYGYMCSWLPVDDQAADFIAVHCKTNHVLKIPLKGRISVERKYFGKDIYMAFPKDDSKPLKDWMIVPLDKLLELFISPASWDKNHGRSNGKIPLKILNGVRQLSIIEPVTLT